MSLGGDKFTKLGATLADLQDTHADRLTEANELVLAGRFGSAVATALYSLEIFLKVLICRKLDLAQLPTGFQIHDLAGLLVLSGLRTRMESLGSHPVKSNWEALLALNDRHTRGEFRYEPNAKTTQAQANDVLNQHQNATDGVLTWLITQS
jgi:hypothetical protein